MHEVGYCSLQLPVGETPKKHAEKTTKKKTRRKNTPKKHAEKTRRKNAPKKRAEKNAPKRSEAERRRALLYYFRSLL